MEPIRVTSRSFRGRQSLAIAGMTFAGLAVVWIAATAGLHPVVTTALLIAVMLWLALRAGGEVVYTLDERGVRREFRSLLAARAGLAASATELGWDEIASFRHQRDMSRSFQEVESIELQGPTGPPWIVTDRQDPAGFARFRDAFLLRVGTRTAAVRAPDFYATWRARALTACFWIATTGLIWAAATERLEASRAVAVGLFAVPGTLYMSARCMSRRGAAND